MSARVGLLLFGAMLLALSAALGFTAAAQEGPRRARRAQRTHRAAAAPVHHAEDAPAVREAPADVDVPAAPAEPPRARTTGHGSITDGIDCSACHTTAAWGLGGEGTGSGGFDHSRTGFPLTGRHRTSTCTDCHQSGRETQRACVSCHEDEHQGRLGRTCDRCHSARDWNETRPIELHRATRLPLTGMHVLADCTECHQRTGERQWSAAPAECVSCHAADAEIPNHPDHLGRDGTTPLPRDCSMCHRPAGWSPAFVPDAASLPGSGMPGSGLAGGALSSLSAPPDHDLRFRISSGVHRAATCDSCHTNPDAPRAIACVGCHAHDRVQLAQTHRGMAIPLDGPGCLACHPGGMRR